MTVFQLLVEVCQKLRMQIIYIMGCPDFGLMMFYVLIYTSHHLELMKATCRLGCLGSLSLLSVMKVMMV
jgi:hypothetical protein